MVIPSKLSLSQTLDALKTVKDGEEFATLMVMVSEFYAAGNCNCEQVEAALGDKADRAKACLIDVKRSRDEMLQTFKQVYEGIKNG